MYDHESLHLLPKKLFYKRILSNILIALMIFFKPNDWSDRFLLGCKDELNRCFTQLGYFVKWDEAGVKRSSIVITFGEQCNLLNIFSSVLSDFKGSTYKTG